ncbi:hypothetical protein [Micrococcus sp. TA1]|uniref:hypothetical protein n=1 Tax=Micrococcus sp. TA1 TaxID=681627 RepID=UPI0016199EB6|nr:hypothetical protein [Micrococcus sp. TA1]MBB5749991.1 hypothetical protein [Micrococcus sp. TA1]
MRAVLRTLVPAALFLSLLAPAGAANAATERVEPFSFTVDDCEGGTIRGEGTLQAAYEIQPDWSISVEGDARGTAVGDQGNEYVLEESHSEVFALGDYTFDYRADLISQGSAPDEVLLVHYDPGSGLTFETECDD